MKQKPPLIIMMMVLFFNVVLLTNSFAWSFEKQTPTPIPKNQIIPQSFESFERSGTYCEIFNDTDNPSYYSANFDSGVGIAVYMNPAECGASPYPFKITHVRFYLYTPDETYKWPVALRVSIRDSNLGDSCSGPQDLLYFEDFSMPSDSAYPLMMILSLESPCWVNQPFFLEIAYTEPRDSLHPHPSLVMDNDVPPSDTCDNWGISQGLYYEWSDFWGSPPPGDAIIRVAGHTSAEECDTIPLSPGWQWVSTSVDPDPCKMESLFVNCWDDLDIAIACNGDFCIPGVGCWIDCWNVSEMYKVHMADTCAIQVCGSKVPTNTPIPFPTAGWKCISYFPECPLEPETALVSIWDNMNIVKNDAGDFCIPGVGCWIECMLPNEGYKVHLKNPDTLIYPTSCPPCPPPLAKKNGFPGFAKTTHFSYLGNTGESYSIVVNSIELNGKLPEVGDEIGVFTTSGLCVGGGVWQGDLLGIAVWQDDERTEELDGFQVGEEMAFKLWDKSQNKEIELSANFQRGDGRFGTGAYALVTLKAFSPLLPKELELAQNYPNPFNPGTIIQFSIPKPNYVKLEIVNLLGQKVASLIDGYKQPGNYQVRWEGRDNQGNPVANGIYFCRLITDERIIVRKMVLIK